jgi:hypothetical protein
MADDMDANERIERMVALKEADRIGIGPQIFYDAARVHGVTIKQFFNDIDVAIAAEEAAWQAYGQPDMAPCGSLFVPAYTGGFPLMSLFWTDWTLPGVAGYSEDMVPQFIEKDFMGPNGYELLIDEGLFRFMRFDKAGMMMYAKHLGMFPKIIAMMNRFKERKIPMWGGPGYALGATHTPFEMFMSLRGIQNMMLDVHRRPDKIIAASEATVDGLIAMGEVGASMPGGRTIFCGGPSGYASDFISPKSFEKLVFPYLKKMVNAFVADGFVPHLHVHNNIVPILEYFKEFPKGKCVLYIDDRTDIFKAKEVLAGHMCIMGNVRASTLSLGTPNDIEKIVKDICLRCKEGSGLIVSVESADDFKPENVKALVDTCKKYGQYRA